MTGDPELRREARCLPHLEGLSLYATRFLRLGLVIFSERFPPDCPAPAARKLIFGVGSVAATSVHGASRRSGLMRRFGFRAILTIWLFSDGSGLGRTRFSRP